MSGSADHLQAIAAPSVRPVATSARRRSGTSSGLLTTVAMSASAIVANAATIPSRSASLPLVKVLEAGTWFAGRALAAERRKDGIALAFSQPVDRYEAVKPENFSVKAIALGGGEKTVAIQPVIESDGKHLVLRGELPGPGSVLRIVCQNVDEHVGVDEDQSSPRRQGYQCQLPSSAPC